MKIFKHLKIVTKLALAFMILITLMIIIGITGYKSIGDIEGRLNDIFLVRLPAIDFIIEADRDLQQLLVAERSMIFSAVNSDAFKGLLEDYSENMKQSEERFENYKKLAQTQEEKEIILKYEQIRKEWQQITKQIVEGRLADTRDGRRLALDLSLGNASVKFEEMRNYLDQLTEINLNLADIAQKKASYKYTITSFFFIGIISFGIILGIILAYIITKNIAKPIKEIVGVANDIADGDMTINELEIKSTDELGMLVVSFNKMLYSLKYKMSIIQKIAEGAGDFTINVELASDKDIFGKTISKMLNSLNNILGQVNSTIEQVASGSNQVAQASQSLSQGATEQASSLEQITSSITEIHSQAKQNTDSAIQASGLAKKATENANNGNKQMQDLVIAMDAINKSADMIKKIVKVIDDIAFQTNLLALNANVEAARAGKYGKGFAVVAEEVRNLAGRSAKSVQETTQMVEETIKNIENGNNLVNITAKQLDDIMNSTNKVSDFLAEIAIASKEQTQGLDQINQGLGQIDIVTQSNTANTEQSASAAEELASQIQELKNTISNFKLNEMNNNLNILSLESQNNYN